MGARAPRPPGRRVAWDPDAAIELTPKGEAALRACAEHKRLRYEALRRCATVREAMRLTVQPTRAGGARAYRPSDLTYDVRAGYVAIGPRAPAAPRPRAARILLVTVAAAVAPVVALLLSVATLMAATIAPFVWQTRPGAARWRKKSTGGGEWSEGGGPREKTNGREHK